MSNEAIAKLKAAVGEEYVLEGAATGGYLKGAGRPLAVVLPGSAAEVSEIVRLANNLGLKLAVGGSVVDAANLDGGIALAMTRMNRLLEIDRANLVAQVEPGMPHRDFLSRTAAAGLNFPVDPYIAATSSIGGCFARGDADARSFQYGPTRTYLLGFEMVLPTGEILDIGNKCIKNVAGYDFIHLAVGSLGTLGIFTRLMVKLLPPPQAKASLIATFPTLGKATAALETLLRRNIHPARASVLGPPLAAEVFPDLGGQLVMLAFEGYRESTKALIREVSAVFTLAGAGGVRAIDDAGDDAGEHAALWDRWLAVKGKLNCPYTTDTIDFSVGPLKLAAALAALEKVDDFAAGVNIEALLGNIRVVLPAGLTGGDKEALAGKLNTLAMAHGGGIAGCLGTRLACRAHRDPEMWEAITGLLQSLRGQFDPRGVMAPGVTFK